MAGGKQSLVQDELENTDDCCDPGICSITPLPGFPSLFF
jgi:hypothetical protein